MPAVREEELVEQARAAEGAVEHARNEMQRAETRCAAAEAAKIELSLRLAAALSEQEVAEDVSAVPSVSARSVRTAKPAVCSTALILHTACCCPPLLCGMAELTRVHSTHRKACHSTVDCRSVTQGVLPGHTVYGLPMQGYQAVA